MFPDFEAELISFLAPLLALEVLSERPPNITSLLPIIQVARLGGTDDGISDVATILVDVFGPTRARSYELAATVRALLSATPLRTPHAVIDRVETVTAPYLVPYADVTVRRFTATYKVTARRTGVLI